MGFRISDKNNDKFPVKGLSHVAIVVKDMKKTVDFYEGILGFPLIKTTEIPGRAGQHFFFDMGDGQGSLAFFWFPTAKEQPPGVTVPRKAGGDLNDEGLPYIYLSAIGSMHHIAFSVEPEQILEYKKKLEDAGIPVSDVLEHHNYDADGNPIDGSLWLSSIYFPDPDGVNLEFGAWHRPFNDEDTPDAPGQAHEAELWIQRMRHSVFG